MDYEEKYEQALERCKKEFNFNNLAYSHEEIKQKLERVFPELNDDERIKKEIIEYLEQSQFGEEHYQVDDDIVRGYIAWLEKQDPNRLEKEIELAYKTADEVQYRNGFKAGQNEVLENPQKYGLKKQGKQKSIWSEKDDLNLNQAIYVCHQYGYLGVEIWLKSFRERMKGETK